MQRSLIFATVIILISGCTSTPEKKEIHLTEGPWRMEMTLQKDVVLPFRFDWVNDAGRTKMVIHNSEEEIEVEDITLNGDSVFIVMPVFGTEFKGKIHDENTFSGLWYNYSRGHEYYIPFKAMAGDQARFPISDSETPADIAPVWETSFRPDTEDQYDAVGKFSQEGSTVTGTFLTETGDTRYLEGVAGASSLKLSAFDGEHAFLFVASLNEEGNLSGTFYSGTHWEEPWTAFPNPDAKLRDAETLTYLNPGYDRMEFTFPDLDSNLVSLDDPKFRDKVVIVQLLGSWCPNCMDETKLFVRWYEKYQPKGLEIIGLAFERGPDFDTGVKSVQRLKEYFGVDYEILMAHYTDDKMAAGEKLPMLNHVMSFPTSVFINREGKVERIHTGFNGPGTGALYDEFVEEYSHLIEEMLEG